MNGVQIIWFWRWAQNKLCNCIFCHTFKNDHFESNFWFFEYSQNTSLTVGRCIAYYSLIFPCASPNIRRHFGDTSANSPRRFVNTSRVFFLMGPHVRYRHRSPPVFFIASTTLYKLVMQILFPIGKRICMITGLLVVTCVCWLLSGK